jgi:hypothetical protein
MHLCVFQPLGVAHSGWVSYVPRYSPSWRRPKRFSSGEQGGWKDLLDAGISSRVFGTAMPALQECKARARHVGVQRGGRHFFLRHWSLATAVKG